MNDGERNTPHAHDCGKGPGGRGGGGGKKKIKEEKNSKGSKAQIHFARDKSHTRTHQSEG